MLDVYACLVPVSHLLPQDMFWDRLVFVISTDFNYESTQEILFMFCVFTPTMSIFSGRGELCVSPRHCSE